MVGVGGVGWPNDKGDCYDFGAKVEAHARLTSHTLVCLVYPKKGGVSIG